MHVYNQLLLMSAIFGVLYLIAKLFSRVSLRYFTATWHYRTYLFLYAFLFVPFHKCFSLLESRLEYQLPVHFDVIAVQSFEPIQPPSSVVAPVALAPEAVSPASLLDVFTVLNLWAAGTVGFIVVAVVRNYMLRRRMFCVCELVKDEEVLDISHACKQALGIKRGIPVYRSAYVGTPFITGIFRPRIVLPEHKFNKHECHHIFLHELTHWKHLDPWTKYMVLFIHALHWFNPLAYAARRDIDRFCELACDESVIRSMNPEERRRYCELILQLLWNVADRKASLSSAFSNKRKHLERRMEMILKNRTVKNNKWIRLSATVLTLALAFGGAVAAYAATGEVGTKEALQKNVPQATVTPVTSSSEPDATIGAKSSLSTPIITSVTNDTVTAEPLAESGAPTGGIGVLSNNLVISDTNISQSNGTYERSWSQPTGWGYYRFYVNNTTNTSVTVQIQENGHTQNYSLSANSNNTWTQSAANSGTHKIIVTTSDGRTFTGDVSVRIADAPF